MINVMKVYIIEEENRKRYVHKIELPNGDIIERDYKTDLINFENLKPFVYGKFNLFFNGEHTQNCTLTYVDLTLFKYNINSFSNHQTYSEYSK
jgi:hypothetical protein